MIICVHMNFSSRLNGLHEGGTQKYMQAPENVFV